MITKKCSMIFFHNAVFEIVLGGLVVRHYFDGPKKYAITKKSSLNHDFTGLCCIKCNKNQVLIKCCAWEKRKLKSLKNLELWNWNRNFPKTRIDCRSFGPAKRISVPDWRCFCQSWASVQKAISKTVMFYDFCDLLASAYWTYNKSECLMK